MLCNFTAILNYSTKSFVCKYVIRIVFVCTWYKTEVPGLQFSCEEITVVYCYTYKVYNYFLPFNDQPSSYCFFICYCMNIIRQFNPLDNETLVSFVCRWRWLFVDLFAFNLYPRNSVVKLFNAKYNDQT